MSTVARSVSPDPNKFNLYPWEMPKNKSAEHQSEKSNQSGQVKPPKTETKPTSPAALPKRDPLDPDPDKFELKPWEQPKSAERLLSPQVMKGMKALKDGGSYLDHNHNNFITDEKNGMPGPYYIEGEFVHDKSKTDHALRSYFKVNTEGKLIEYGMEPDREINVPGESFKTKKALNNIPEIYQESLNEIKSFNPLKNHPALNAKGLEKMRAAKVQAGESGVGTVEGYDIRFDKNIAQFVGGSMSFDLNTGKLLEYGDGYSNYSRTGLMFQASKSVHPRYKGFVVYVLEKFNEVPVEFDTEAT
jgi:hypothetical protein